MISKHPLNHNFEIFFNSENHSYIDNNKENYTSVTSFINKFFPTFNTEEIATNCAKKRGVSKESLILEWKKISDESIELGNSIHNYFDCLLTNKKLPIIDKLYKIEIDKIYNSIVKKLNLVYSEKIIFSPKLKIAGTFDALFLTKDKSKYVLIDWKTCKKIDYKNDWKSFAFKPIEYLHNCNHIHYSLQLELYKYILKNEGYINSKIPIICKIIHIKPNESKSIDIVNLEKEIQILFNVKKSTFLH